MNRLNRLAALLFALASASASAAPPDAVVRIPSHGASGTVIQTGPGKTLILSCAHAFEGKQRTAPIRLDVPHPDPGPAKRVGIKLVKVDYTLDLSLIELADGPLPYVCRVAPADHVPATSCLSVGYDEMRLPSTRRNVSLLGSSGMTTYTRERPWHGRSGGALIDQQAGCLIGVVQGYEVTGQRRGLYVSHGAILRFLERSPTPPPRSIPRSLAPPKKPAPCPLNH
jgi:hypothetical protein